MAFTLHQLHIRICSVCVSSNRCIMPWLSLSISFTSGSAAFALVQIDVLCHGVCVSSKKMYYAMAFKTPSAHIRICSVCVSSNRCINYAMAFTLHQLHIRIYSVCVSSNRCIMPWLSLSISYTSGSTAFALVQIDVLCHGFHSPSATHQDLQCLR